ncbi:MAG: hypothetical protein AVDCRST_MAG33-1237 [uncultured Thermomicrobiales bacterium]|uniref:Uncharacterized protein n=1 Tax=uncultured Thermomicrobiales bacterium TaxID=1645740 RepID=A0A6J4UQD7_9BACT|nr:MAG: hypothetical protein AVDCRST_MAG33-1237 [uncultured Thermomicrobiales bacterium]
MQAGRAETRRDDRRADTLGPTVVVLPVVGGPVVTGCLDDGRWSRPSGW